MYQIVGVERSQRRIIVATPVNAREALTHYRAAQNLFPRIIILSPDGVEIDGFELSRRAKKEADDTYA